MEHPHGTVIVPDYPLTSVEIADWSSDAAAGVPTLTLAAAGILSPTWLPALLCADRVALTLEAPPEGHPHAAPGPHPLIDVHLNPGPGYGHDGCMSATVCIMCHLDLWHALFVHEHGWLTSSGSQRQAPFLLTRGNEAATHLEVGLDRAR